MPDTASSLLRHKWLQFEAASMKGSRVSTNYVDIPAQNLHVPYGSSQAIFPHHPAQWHSITIYMHSAVKHVPISLRTVFFFSAEDLVFI